MKSLFIIIIGVLAYYFLFHSKHNSGINIRSITIKDLKENPNLYSDSMVVLQNVHVLSSTILLHYSESIITDESGDKLIAITNKPYTDGQNISQLSGRYELLFKDKDKKCEFFITDIDAVRDVVAFLKQTMIN